MKREQKQPTKRHKRLLPARLHSEGLFHRSNSEGPTGQQVVAEGQLRIEIEARGKYGPEPEPAEEETAPS